MTAADLHPADVDLLEVEVDADGRSGRFTLVPGLVRHDGALYGGTGLAVSVLAMQGATGRDVLWTSTQFVSSPQMGEVVEWTTEVLAEGRRTAQVLVRATAGGAVAFMALGSTGIAKDDGLTGQYRTMPVAGGPEESRPWDSATSLTNPDSWVKKLELRDAPVEEGLPQGMWARRRDGRPFTPAAIAFAADFVPLGVARSAGRLGAGSSLDNSMRFRPGESTEWIFLELRGDFAHGGYGHGVVLVWGQDGTLVASGSQTAAMRYLWDEGEAPRIPIPD